MQQMGIKGIPIGAKEMVKAHFGALKPYFNDLIGKMPWLKKFKNTDLAPYDHLMDKIDKSYETFKDVGQPEDAILRRGTTALYGTAASIRDFSTDKYFKKTFGLMTYGRNKEVSWQKLKGQDIFKNKKQHDTAYDKAWLDKIFSPQNYKDFSKGSKVYATIIPSIEKGWRDYQNDLIRIHSDFVSYEKPIQTKFIQGLRESPSGRWVTNLITWKNAQIANTRRAFHELFDPRPEAKVNGLITLTRTLTAGALMGALLWDDLNKRRYKQRKPFEFSQYSLDPSAAFLPRFSKMMHDFAKTYKEDPAKATKNLTVDAGDIAGNFVIGASGALVMTVTALQDPVLLVSRVASMMGYTKRGRKKKGTMKQRGFKSKGGF